ncbi:hypothetical protein SLEP1_g10529 [Rubroshorea leprosula]|uniref:Reverse transcriptase Ty1/copia-type domain-containing protein n=1 Tax=Rubroshorea leprosula TaxID=152421 RepID=A0AAV5IE43_9ROSI|nr:hypothetical protein SLEP1_g10529 [Rubroshorea leprosula]
MIDPFLKEKIAPVCLIEFMEIALSCIHPDPNERPSMGEVEVTLELALKLQEKADLVIKADNPHAGYAIEDVSFRVSQVYNEEIHVEQPDGFVKASTENKVYLLKKALYGLKQAPRAWYSRIDEYLLKLGFVKSLTEVTLYVKEEGIDLLIVTIYVDDFLITGSNEKLIQQFKKKYANEILNQFAMANCKTVSTPMVPCEKLRSDDGAAKIDAGVYRSLIGRLLYLSATRPHIMHSVSLLSRFMHSPSEIHFKAAKRILRYVKGTTDFGVLYKCSTNVKLIGFTDGDWAGSEEDMKSTSGQCFSIGSRVISWSSKKQDSIAKSTAEAEYIAVSLAADQAVWFRKLMNDLKQPQMHPTELFCDNLFAVAIVKNPILHGLHKCRFETLRDKLGMSSISVEEE